MIDSYEQHDITRENFEACFKDERVQENEKFSLSEQVDMSESWKQDTIECWKQDILNDKNIDYANDMMV